jgi:hypothetical protein
MHFSLCEPNMAGKSRKSMDEFPIESFVYKGFPVAMFDDRRVSMGK